MFEKLDVVIIVDLICEQDEFEGIWIEQKLFIFLKNF